MSDAGELAEGRERTFDELERLRAEVAELKQALATQLQVTVTARAAVAHLVLERNEARQQAESARASRATAAGLLKESTARSERLVEAGKELSKLLDIAHASREALVKLLATVQASRDALLAQFAPLLRWLHVKGYN